MYRILPLFVIFFSLGPFLIAVGNLTDKKVKNELIAVQDSKSKKKNIKEKIVEKKIEEHQNNSELSSNNILVESITNNRNVTSDPIVLLEKKLKKDFDSDKKITNDKIIVQFGAFSKLSSAKNQMIKIEKSISKVFEKFNLNILEDEKNLFKLIYKTNNLKNANEICRYSKSKNIACYVKK